MGILGSIKEDLKSAGTSKDAFFYVRDGDKIRVRFLQELDDGTEILFHEQWEQRIKAPCQQLFGRVCPYDDDEDIRHKKYYAWAVYNYDENRVQIFMYPVNNCSPVPLLLEMSEAYGTVMDRDYIICCSGKQKDKRFSVVPGDKNKFRIQKARPFSRKKILELVDKAFPVEKADEEPETESGAYEGMRPRKLYDLCMERGIEAEIRKPEKYYINLLEEYDRQQEDWGDADTSEDEYDDEWGSEDDGFMNVPEGEEELPWN